MKNIIPLLLVPMLLGLVGMADSCNGGGTKPTPPAHLVCDIPSIEPTLEHASPLRVELGKDYEVPWDGMVDEVRFTGLDTFSTYWFWIEVDPTKYDPLQHAPLELTLYDNGGNFLKYNAAYSIWKSSQYDTLACIRYRPRTATPNASTDVNLKISQCGGVPQMSEEAAPDFFTIHMAAKTAFKINPTPHPMGNPIPDRFHRFIDLSNFVLTYPTGDEMRLPDPIELDDNCTFTTLVASESDSNGQLVQRPGNGVGLAGGVCSTNAAELTESQIEWGIHNYSVYWIYPPTDGTYQISLNCPPPLVDPDDPVPFFSPVGLAVFEDPYYDLPFCSSVCTEPCMSECDGFVANRLDDVCRDVAVGVRMVAGSSNYAIPTANACPSNGLFLEQEKMYYILVFGEDVPFACTLTVAKCECP